MSKLYIRQWVVSISLYCILALAYCKNFSVSNLININYCLQNKTHNLIIKKCFTGTIYQYIIIIYLMDTFVCLLCYTKLCYTILLVNIVTLKINIWLTIRVTRYSNIFCYFIIIIILQQIDSEFESIITNNTRY